MRTLPLVLFLSFLALGPVRSARADHDFTEDFDEDGDALADAADINQEFTLSGDAGLFSRVNVGALFSADPLLSVSSTDVNPVDPEAEERELLWSTEDGDDETLALTPDDVAGNYVRTGVSIETLFAATGELRAGARPGAVVHYNQGQFYIAYGIISPAGGGFVINLLLQKKVAPGFEIFNDLDTGPAVSAARPFVPGENYRLFLEVTEPSDDGLSNLCAHLEHVVLRGGRPTFVHLATLSGRDGSIDRGRVGLYASAGTVNAAIQIAFDPAHVRHRESASLTCLMLRLEDVIDRLDPRVEAGDMTGINEEVNLGWKKALLTRVAEAVQFADTDNRNALIQGMDFIRGRADSRPTPPDWVQGQAATQIVQQVDQILDALSSGQENLAAPAAHESSLRPASGGDLESGPNQVARTWSHPARGDVTIEFTTSRPGQVGLRVFDLQGRVVQTLVAGFLPAGTHAVRWGPGAPGSTSAAPGFYLYELKAGGERVVGRLVRIR